MSQRDINYMAIKIEEIQDDIKTILEIVVPMRQELTEVKEIVKDIPVIKTDIETIKYTLKITNNQVRDHEKRITKLEAHPL